MAKTFSTRPSLKTLNTKSGVVAPFSVDVSEMDLILSIDLLEEMDGARPSFALFSV